MALDVSVLTTRAECDEALADLNAELDSYQQRTATLEYASRQATRTLADTAGQVAGLNAEIAAYTAILATPDLTPVLRRQNESKLRRANDRLANLEERGSARSGAARLLAAVDAEQVVAQVAVLTAAKEQVTTRRAALPA
ncbi:hypothetical protein K3G63_05940 [Hymenobacter sp. HSC-4F20]|uniref:hypothetical protein n=1 Tax=Hymenobacter sp. HSC-4F20 TaxID=2864135 RepID=UPI001C73879E|nr:hypothetical protein [Hymenobacter sp. HSC-4F20]MBX0289971.1 hypothetical protein [Hymenobacter sp. HSC-4F20]